MTSNQLRRIGCRRLLSANPAPLLLPVILVILLVLSARCVRVSTCTWSTPSCAQEAARYLPMHGRLTFRCVRQLYPKVML